MSHSKPSAEEVIIKESVHWRVTFWHFCELAKSLGCFFVGNSVLMLGQVLKTSTDKAKMVRFHFLRFARFSWRNGLMKNQILKLA